MMIDMGSVSIFRLHPEVRAHSPVKANCATTGGRTGEGHTTRSTVSHLATPLLITVAAMFSAQPTHGALAPDAAALRVKESTYSAIQRGGHSVPQLRRSLGGQGLAFVHPKRGAIVAANVEPPGYFLDEPLFVFD